MKPGQVIAFDGRYRTNPDDASCLGVFDSAEEAIKFLNGQEFALIDESGEIVSSK